MTTQERHVGSRVFLRAFGPGTITDRIVQATTPEGATTEMETVFSVRSDVGDSMSLSERYVRGLESL